MMIWTGGTETWLDPIAGTPVNVMNFQYDIRNQLTAASDDAAGYAFARDAMGRVTSETISLAGATAHHRIDRTYDADARLSQTRLKTEATGGGTFTDDPINTHTYDDLGRLTTTTQAKDRC